MNIMAYQGADSSYYASLSIGTPYVRHCYPPPMHLPTYIVQSPAV